MLFNLFFGFWALDDIFIFCFFLLLDNIFGLKEGKKISFACFLFVEYLFLILLIFYQIFYLIFFYIFYIYNY